MRPNIFEIATKELSQDAFITWLLQYADEKYKEDDFIINECGNLFVQELIKKQIPNFNERVINVNAGRQRENIDVWAEINNKYLIIIEDKTTSFQHSNQLTRYKLIAEDWCSKNSFEKPICIYLKTGNESQSSLNNIINQGFGIFNRNDFVNLLDKFNSTKNNIFLDFYYRLSRLEKINNDFENKVIGDWNGADWQGFFQFLEKEIEIVNWHFVNNPSGGFWNAVIVWEIWNNIPVYIQLEETKLCFKISTHPDDDVKLPTDVTRGLIRNSIYDLIISKANEYGFSNIRKPDRFGNGHYMTVAIVDSENWLGFKDSKIDKKLVVDSITKYKNFLIDIVSL
jgi:hypothetical protein